MNMKQSPFPWAQQQRNIFSQKKVVHGSNLKKGRWFNLQMGAWNSGLKPHVVCVCVCVHESPPCRCLQLQVWARTCAASKYTQGAMPSFWARTSTHLPAPLPSPEKLLCPFALQKPHSRRAGCLPPALASPHGPLHASIPPPPPPEILALSGFSHPDSSFPLYCLSCPLHPPAPFLFLLRSLPPPPRNELLTESGAEEADQQQAPRCRLSFSHSRSPPAPSCLRSVPLPTAKLTEQRSGERRRLHRSPLLIGSPSRPFRRLLAPPPAQVRLLTEASGRRATPLGQRQGHVTPRSLAHSVFFWGNF